jgi:ATP-dependent DNA ligase
VVVKKLASRYQPDKRGWIKLKTPNYWRRDAEREAIARKHERRRRGRRGYESY